MTDEQLTILEMAFEFIASIGALLVILDLLF